ncbi:MAG: hypothetical protein D6696_20105 [Acidobacteria bacterium]|nr:MAG: hypothetical protein D6696_20105 [Acidobacteriota bacterium]
MTWRALILVPALLIATAAITLAVAVAAPPRALPAPKTDTLAARLLLPYFEVDFTSPQGRTTLFAVRNDDDAPVAVTIDYFEANRPAVPQLSESLTLGPKQVVTTNVRAKNVIRDDDDVARGYAVIRADRPTIQGDYFQLDDANDFAAGDRLVNADPDSPHNELCRFYTIRSFNGGPFDGGTTFTIWLESDVPATGAAPVAFYTVYNEAGDAIFSGQLFRDALAFRVSSTDLGLLGFEVPPFGAIEFELNQTTGHVWAQMSALGRFSVGLGGSCGDEAPAG